MQSLDAFISRRSVRTLLSLATLAVTLPLLVLVLHQGLQQYRAKTAETENRAMDLALNFSLKHEDSLLQARTLLETLSTHPALSAHDKSSLREQFIQIAAKYPQYSYLTMASPDGSLMVSSASADTSINFGDREVFKRVMRGESFAVGQAIISRTTGEPVLPFAAPVKDANGKVAAALLLGLRIDVYQRYFASLNLDKDSRVLLFSPDGTRLLRFPQRGISPVGSQIHAWKIISNFKANSGTFRTVDPLGLDLMYAFIRFLPEYGGQEYLGVLVGIPATDWAGLLWPVLGQTLLLLSLVVAFALAVNASLSRRIVASGLETLASSAVAIGEERPLSGLDSLRGCKEIMELGAAFAAMSDSLARHRQARDRAERELIRESAQLRTILKTAGDGIHMLDTRGRMILCNPAFAGMLGYTVEEAAELTLPDFAVEIAGTEFEPTLRSLIDTPRTFECQFKRKDGSLIEVEVGARGMPLDGKEYLIGSARDITGQKQARLALAESEERFRHIFEQAEVGIFQGSPEGVFLRANQKLCNILGYTPEELAGKNFRDVTHPDDVAASEDILNILVREQRPYLTSNKRYLRKDGSLIWVSRTASAVRDESGKIKYLIGIVEDITERKRAREFRENMERIVRHDLRTPLTGLMQIPMAILDGGNLSAEQREMIELIAASGRRMLNQINSSLELYKIESGTYKLTRRDCDLSRLIADNIALLVLSTDCDPTRILVSRPDGLPDGPVIESDPVLVEIILMNLMRNALEAGGPGDAVAIDISKERDGCVVAITNRQPVPEEMRERFFEKYASAGKVAGLGLGTYSAAIMTRAIGGEISMTTSEEAGTTVTVRIPG